MFTKDSPFRELDDVLFTVWATTIANVGGPDELASEETYRAAFGHTRLFLFLMAQESKFGTVSGRNQPRVTRNPFSFRVPDYSNEGTIEGYLHFDTYAECMFHAYDRIIDGSYWKRLGRDDPYRGAESIQDLLHVYAPLPYNDTPRLIREAVAFLNGLPDEPVVTIPPGEEPVVEFGRVQHPQFESRIVQNSRAWDNLGTRTIRAVAWHRMYGSLWGTDGYFRGEAVNRALTDYGVGVTATDGVANDGKILMWNEPRGVRSPWANGPVARPVGDGAAFVERYGKEGVNRDIASVEISGTSGSTPLSAQARQSIVALTAYWADQYKVSWETFPQIPGEGNRSFVIHHGEINGDKRRTCPGAVIEAETSGMLAEVKALLKSAQTASPPEPVPVPEPEPPLPEYIPGVDAVIASRLFGSVEGEDGRRYQFDRNGPVSKAWVADSVVSGEWPQIREAWRYDDGRRYFIFEGGRSYMVKDGEVVRLRDEA